MSPSTDADAAVATAVGTVTAEQFWRWLAAETPLTSDTPSDVFGFIWRSVPAWRIGTEVDLIGAACPRAGPIPCGGANNYERWGKTPMATIERYQT